MTATTSFAGAWEAVAQEREVRAAVRLVPAGEPGGNDAAAVARIQAHLARWGATPAALAKALDVKTCVVTLLLADAARIPAAQRATLLRDADEWCRADAHERELRAARIIPTAVTRLVGGLARAVRETRTVGLVIGGAGLGKSHALAAVAAELAGQTVVVRATPDARGAKGLLRAIRDAAGAGPAAAVIPSVKGALQALRGSAGLVVIDEVQLISTLALEAARAIFDGGDVGLLLVGTTAARRTLNPATDPLVGPLCSRIALHVDLDRELLGSGRDGRPRKWIDAATVRAIVERHVAQPIDGGGLAQLGDTANFAPGHLRAAVNAVRVGAYLARRRDGNADAPVTEQDVRTALRMGSLEGV